jgi:hypothetical protein
VSERVSISTEGWQAIDKLLANLPYHLAAPVVDVVLKGGVHPLPVSDMEQKAPHEPGTEPAA